MYYQKKIYISFGFVLSIAFFLLSCKNSTVDPNGGSGSADERILFIKYYEAVSEICSIKPDGTDPQIIASNDYAGEGTHGGYHEVMWSPNKSRLVITVASKMADASSALWLMDNDGRLLRELTSDGAAPHWSSDGNTILFSRWSDYYTINVNTKSEKSVLKADAFTSWGSADWSSDGKYILTQEELYWYNDEGKLASSDREVVLLQISDGERIQLTNTDTHDGGAQWSPDESKIAYMSGNYIMGSQIKLMNSDGSGDEILVDTLARYVTIRWSPNGDKIAFAKKKKLEGYDNYEEGSDIYVLDIISGTVERLTNFAADSIIVYIQDWK
jgi:Tol biopolymer transport system component